MPTIRETWELSDADGVGKITGTCGDTVQIQIRVEDERIRESGFLTDGCGTSIAGGSMLTEMIKDKTIEGALVINSDDLLRSLDGLPEDHAHCTVLAVDTLHAVIDNYTELRSNKQTYAKTRGEERMKVRYSNRKGRWHR